jgi:hypothetical protein
MTSDSQNKIISPKDLIMYHAFFLDNLQPYFSVLIVDDFINSIDYSLFLLVIKLNVVFILSVNFVSHIF